MPAAAILAVFALAAAAPAVGVASDEVRPPCAASQHGTVGEDNCYASGSRSTMLIQVNAKHAKRKLTLLTHPDASEKEARKVDPNSPLARILKRAQARSSDSGQPFEYLLDVDYLHDANNPLDNNGEESSTKERSTKDPERDHHYDPEHQDLADDVVEFELCVTQADPRVVTSALTSVARVGTRCLFGTDSRDEGSHCIMQGGEYGSYGWCYTTKDRSEWGSCSERCPLSGAAALLEKRIDAMDEMVGDILKKVRNVTDCKRSKKASKKREKTSALAETLKRVQAPGAADLKKPATMMLPPSFADGAAMTPPQPMLEQHRPQHSGPLLVGKLNTLLRDGLISNEEFEDLKREAESSK